ncbi:MAG TPA: UDP-N-acetylglucosamine 2-epimerase (non-hydrolyzing) [Bryobacteraceae bacterium]|nr:UDP-N-acetylglucosamine 2-epimerase (non-hydrolyzing) [Bryobacteraceae bacterium]
MKILTLLGTRPEIIRLSGVIALLDAHADHVLAHTGQNYDPRLSRIFFDQLGVRAPDVFLGVESPNFAGQIGQILERSHALFLEHRPDRLLVLGDTNSGLAAVIARRLGIPVYHMEAGNRCYDDRVPEEVNRRVIDHSSTVLLPYTERSRQNLLAEGIPGGRIYVTGNPIKQVIDRFAPQIAQSRALEEYGLAPGKYFLATAHRSENVDSPVRLRSLIEGLEALSRKYGYPVVYPLHPRTRSRAEAAGIQLAERAIQFLPPLGFFDFIRLEQHAFSILSDSGTVQEEACLFGVPNVTLREVTERPETLECGSNILCGVDRQAIADAVRLVTRQAPTWQPPKEYLEPGVAETVCRIVLGLRMPDAAETAWRDTCAS